MAMRTSRVGQHVAMVLVVALLCPQVRAQQVTTEAGLNLVPNEKVVFIKNAARLEKPRVDLWRWAWFTGFAVLTLAQAIPVPFFDDAGARADFIVGAASTAIGALSLLFLPPTIAQNADEFAALADDDSALPQAEKLLADGAESEAFGVSWLMHVGNFALNVVASGLLGIIWHRWQSAALNFALGMVVGEAMIMTQPVGLVSAHTQTQEGGWAIVPFAVPDGAGLAFGARF